jgi:hypothetical protein
MFKDGSEEFRTGYYHVDNTASTHPNDAKPQKLSGLEKKSKQPRMQVTNMQIYIFRLCRIHSPTLFMLVKRQPH